MKRKPRPETDQVYGVPLKNGRVGVVHLCHVHKFGPSTFSVTAGFFPETFEKLPDLIDTLDQIDLTDPFAVCSITNSVIREGEWKLVGIRKCEYRGIQVLSRIKGTLQLFDDFELDPDWILDMYHGCYPWGGFYDPLFLDKLLLPGKSRPSSARLRSDFTKDELTSLGFK
jgi:hypothetical protein